jgi:CDP-diacylglycerol--serine O-phosphatidyltransferase
VKKQIPNIITLLNLLSGLIALIFVFQKNWIWAAIFVGLGILFDFLDGLLARNLNAFSRLGLELDSLADLVTSGVVPAFTMYFLIQDAQSAGNYSFKYLPYFGLLIALGSAYRLAKFNVDDRQTNSFIGLPTPANALFIMSLPLIMYVQQPDFVSQQLLHPYILIGIAVFSTFILNAELPLFSLKFKDFSWTNNREKYFIIILTLILLPLLKFLAIPIIIILYILLSVISKNHNKHEIVD